MNALEISATAAFARRLASIAYADARNAVRRARLEPEYRERHLRTAAIMREHARGCRRDAQIADGLAVQWGDPRDCTAEERALLAQADDDIRNRRRVKLPEALRQELRAAPRVAPALPAFSPCPYCGCEATRLRHEIAGDVTDCVHCDGCRVTWIQVSERWFQQSRKEAV